MMNSVSLLRVPMVLVSLIIGGATMLIPPRASVRLRALTRRRLSNPPEMRLRVSVRSSSSGYATRVRVAMSGSVRL
jgi:hypothetical protein